MGSYKVVNHVVNRTIKKNISYHRYLLKWYEPKTKTSYFEVFPIILLPIFINYHLLMWHTECHIGQYFFYHFYSQGSCPEMGLC